MGVDMSRTTDEQIAEWESAAQKGSAQSRVTALFDALDALVAERERADGLESDLAISERMHFATHQALQDTEDRIAKVREIHEPRRNASGRVETYSDLPNGWCVQCSEDEHLEPWPCPTIQALEGE
jgi:hypothetical protein